MCKTSLLVFRGDGNGNSIDNFFGGGKNRPCFVGVSGEIRKKHKMPRIQIECGLLVGKGGDSGGKGKSNRMWG